MHFALKSDLILYLKPDPILSTSSSLYTPLFSLYSIEAHLSQRARHEYFSQRIRFRRVKGQRPEFILTLLFFPSKFLEKMTVGQLKRGRGGMSRGGRSSQDHRKSATTPSLMKPTGYSVAFLALDPRSPAGMRRSSDSHQEQPLESQSLENLEDELDLTLEADNGSASTVSCSNKKRGRGKYKSKTIDLQTKNGKKIIVEIPKDSDKPVGPGSRDIVNYCGLIMRNTISFRDKSWKNIASKHEEAMWLKVKDKFESKNTSEQKLQCFVISTMQRLYRSWKARLREVYHLYNNDKERLALRPVDVDPEDWKYLIGYFKTPEFKAKRERNMKNREKQITKHTCGTRSFAEVEESTRNPETGEKETPDKIWMIQHTRKNDEGELVWLDPQSQLIHGQLKELVSQQQSNDVEDRMTNDEILVSILGERTGYVRGKGYGKKAVKKSRQHQANLDACVSSAMEIARHEMQAEMEQKLQTERAQMAAELRTELEQEMQSKCEHEVQRKREEEREKMKLDLL